MNPDYKVKINTNSACLKAYININSNLLIVIDDWCSMLTDRGDGYEDEIEYGNASMELSIENAIKLRDALNGYIMSKTI